MSESQKEDALLVARAQAGDRNAFNALVQRYEVRAYQYAYRLCRNQELASDLVSETFLRVYNALHHFKGNSSFATWLYRIMTNCFLDYRKRDKSKMMVSIDAAMQGEDSELERDIKDTARNPQEETERTHRLSKFEEAISQLADFQQSMLVMYHAETMSYEEIAAALDLPVGTVKSRLNRARIALRDLLIKDEELFRI